MKPARALGITAGLVASLFLAQPSKPEIVDGRGGDTLSGDANPPPLVTRYRDSIEGPMLLGEREISQTGSYVCDVGYKITVPSGPYGYWGLDRIAELFANVIGYRVTGQELYRQNEGVVGPNPNMIHPGMVLQVRTYIFDRPTLHLPSMPTSWS